jgi:exopolyphosphatase/guanosine-5'-triphosphate,3'-diphosphate pyrophosphatase
MPDDRLPAIYAMLCAAGKLVSDPPASFRRLRHGETLRLGAGLDARGRLTADAQRAALACLARFGERIRGFPRSSVRVVATNTLRIASNAASFLPRAEKALGFPIDIITGHEEARLIYLGVAHVLPASDEPRLVVDIAKHW